MIFPSRSLSWLMPLLLLVALLLGLLLSGSVASGHRERDDGDNSRSEAGHRDDAGVHQYRHTQRQDEGLHHHQHHHHHHHEDSRATLGALQLVAQSQQRPSEPNEAAGGLGDGATAAGDGGGGGSANGNAGDGGGSDYAVVTDEVTTIDPELATVEDFEPWLEEQIEDQFRRSLPTFARFNGDSNVTIDCSAALLKFMLAMRNMKPWALRMLDSNGRPSSGLASGSVADLGDYDQCLAVEAPDGDDGVDYTGQYCTLYLNPLNVPLFRKIIRKFQEDGEFVGKTDPLKWLKQDLFLGLRLGICMPSKCTSQEMQYIIKQLIGKYGVKPTIAGCQLPGKGPVTLTQKYMFGLISTFTFIIIVASLTEYYLIYTKTQPPQSVRSVYRVLHCFSAVDNTRKLLSTRAPPDSDASRLRFIHGLRFFSASWVILGHTYFLIMPTALGESINIIEIQKDFWFCLIANAFPCIQTFLFMSGFLLSYNILKYLSRYRKSLVKPIFLLLVRRYVRLTAPVMFLVGLFLCIPRFASGPLYSEYKDILLGACENQWWRVLLHVNNFLPFFDMCLAHLWYISVDWQIYSTLWVIPILMIKRKRLGYFMCSVVIIATAAAVALVTFANGYQPTPIYSDSNINKSFDAGNDVYFKPYAHAGSFCVGIITGHLVVAYGSYKLATATQGALWAAATAIALAVQFGPYKWFAGAPHEGWDAIAYAATHRTAWAVSLGWLTYACATGRGGLVNRLLSWKGLIPMSRLSFSAFMLQTIVLIWRTMVIRDRMIFRHSYMIKDFFMAYMVTYMCSFILYLLIEAPIGNLEKMIFMGKNSPKFSTAATDAANAAAIRAANGEDDENNNNNADADSPKSSLPPPLTGSATTVSDEKKPVGDVDSNNGSPNVTATVASSVSANRSGLSVYQERLAGGPTGSNAAAGVAAFTGIAASTVGAERRICGGQNARIARLAHHPPQLFYHQPYTATHTFHPHYSSPHHQQQQHHFYPQSQLTQQPQQQHHQQYQQHQQQAQLQHQQQAYPQHQQQHPQHQATHHRGQTTNDTRTIRL